MMSAAMDDSVSSDPRNHPSLLLISLVGLPGAGKSTLSQYLSACPPEGCAACETVHFDDDDALYDADNTTKSIWTPEKWHSLRSNALARAVTAVNLLARECLFDGCRRALIVDDNAWLRSMRRPLWRAARDAGAASGVVVGDGDGSGGGGGGGGGGCNDARGVVVGVAYISLWVDAGGEESARNAARGNRSERVTAGRSESVTAGGAWVGDGPGPGYRVSDASTARMVDAFEPPLSCGDDWEAPHAWRVDSRSSDSPRETAEKLRFLLSQKGWDSSLIPRQPPPLPSTAAATAAERARAFSDFTTNIDAALRQAVAVAFKAGSLPLPRTAKADALATAKHSINDGSLQRVLGWGREGAADRLAVWAQAAIDRSS